MIDDFLWARVKAFSDASSSPPPFYVLSVLFQRDEKSHQCKFCCSCGMVFHTHTHRFGLCPACLLDEQDSCVEFDVV